MTTATQLVDIDMHQLKKTKEKQFTVHISAKQTTAMSVSKPSKYIKYIKNI